MSKCLVLFVEGDTEVEFYKQVVANARKLHPAGRFDTNIEYRNVRGVGGFKSIALRKFIKEIKPKYDDDCEFTIVLCSDTDVFDFAPKPPIKWDEVKKELTDNGASQIIHVQAKRSIEDWFLYDIEGILGFLRLGKNTKVSGKNGYDKLDTLETTVKEKGDTDTEKKIKRSTLKYIKSGDKPAYITTLKRILKLRCQLDADGVGEIKEKLKLKFYNSAKKLYDEMVRLEEIDELNACFENIKRVKIVAADGATNYMRECVDAMDDATFDMWMKYHFSICERMDLIGATNHALDILVKNNK